MNSRVGQGIDIHKLDNGTPLIVGGVLIPSDKGSIGHSDGDVLYHAIVDALLGALSLGDIGQHFPSSDMQWKDASSSLFIEHTYKLVQNKGFQINNMDATIILQKPQLTEYIQEIKSNISNLLFVDREYISIKATTADYLGFTGRGDGIAASATVLLIEV